MRLSVNIDHFVTLREARKNSEPDPVLAAMLAEQAGAEGIVCHIRADRRHIKEKDLYRLREAVRTSLNVEMAATEDMKKIALKIKPDFVSLVPERPEELTTEGGLDVAGQQKHLESHIRELQSAGVKVSIFVDTDIRQIESCRKLNVDRIEINTGPYADSPLGRRRDEALESVRLAAAHAADIGLEVHAGHGLDYHNVEPVAAIEDITGFSIGFSIVARSAIVGIDTAVRDMGDLLLT
ncbi:MAG: pyridoxine 5'-phosphate synthase [Candidatus Aminicenantes bacterium]|nr:pyridoxine 5'-phosphate synthase [Candidatus Aminicenantes bacterium]